MNRQTTIFDFMEMETPEAPKVDFSCFASFRVGKFGIGTGECKMPKLQSMKCLRKSSKAILITSAGNLQTFKLRRIGETKKGDINATNRC